MPSVVPRLSPLSNNQKTQPFSLSFCLFLCLCLSLSQCPAPNTFPHAAASRCFREKESRGTGGGGQQLWIWKNNSCDSHIVIPTFVSGRVRQQVSSQRENCRTHGALSPHPHCLLHLPLKKHIWPCLELFPALSLQLELCLHCLQRCVSELEEFSLHTCWILSERWRANYVQATLFFWSWCISQII